MLPNFLFVGSGKSGSTSLYYHLKDHPEIYMSPLKETRFFVNTEVNPYFDSHAVKTFEEYRNLFAGHSGEKAIGEMSPEYLASPAAAKLIRETLGDIKIIIILRHPVERAISLFNHLKRDRLIEFNRIDKAIQSDVFWKKIFYEEGLYCEHLNVYRNTFSAENIYINTYNKFQGDPELVVRQIYGFLGVDVNFTPNLNIKTNVSGEYKRKVYSLLVSSIRNSAAKVWLQKKAPAYVRDKLAITFNNVVNNVMLSKSKYHNEEERCALADLFKDELIALESRYGIKFD